MSSDGTLGGLIYAPAGSITVAGRKSSPSAGCMSFVAYDIKFYFGATANVAPCSNFPGLAGTGSRALLGG